MVGYIRVSTAGQADEGVSLDVQRARLAAYCGLYGHELVSIEADEGISAKNMRGRAGLRAALDALEAGTVDGIIVSKLDRLTRSVRDLGALLEGPFARGALVSVGEQVDTSTAGGRLVLNVLASVAQWEREVIGERIAQVHAYKRARGERSGQVPFGFHLAADGVHLEEHDDEQRAITMIRDLRAGGMSYRAIVAELGVRGVEPRGKRWHMTTVQRLLKRDSA